jgi:hypothetical protein
MTTTMDTLLSATQIDQFNRDGYLVFKRLAPPARCVDMLTVAGDVVFFHSLLFHAGGRNADDAVKTSVVFSYLGESNLPVEGPRSAAGDVAFG